MEAKGPQPFLVPSLCPTTLTVIHLDAFQLPQEHGVVQGADCQVLKLELDTDLAVSTGGYDLVGVPGIVLEADDLLGGPADELL